MKTLRDELNECILDMRENADKLRTLLMRDDIVWPEVEDKPKKWDCVYITLFGRCWAVKGSCNSSHPNCTYRKKTDE